MPTIIESELIKDKDILNEINKYKWCASERSGFDIGFENAAREWINNHSKEYLTQHPGKSALLWFKSQPIYNALNKDIRKFS